MSSLPIRHDPFFRRLAAWLGVGLLSASWLPGLGYYHAADWISWAALVAAGTLLLTAVREIRATTGCWHWIAGALAIPAAVVAPWPYRAAVLLFAAGCLLPARLPDGWQRAERLCGRARGALVLAGVLLIVQGLTVNAYAVLTSRSHELPSPLPSLLGQITDSLGIESAVHGQTVALHSMRQIHHLGATWELFLDPVTLGFLVAGILVWWLCAPGSTKPTGRHAIASIGLPLLLVVTCWLPLRAGLVIAVFLHDVLRTPYEAELDAMQWFWNTWLHLALLVGPVLVFVFRGPTLRGGDERPLSTTSAPRSDKYSDGRSDWRPRLLSGWLSNWRPGWLPVLLAGLGCLSVTVGLLWEPVGIRRAGRVVVEEYHPDPTKIWEPTGRPYDTDWYGQASGYNYACIYDYASRYYRLSRWTEPLGDEALRDCDVLILKVPTRRYTRDEIDAVVRFVEDGGGLLLIGEHTNVYRTSDHLNPVAARFGFAFRDDCLFGIDEVFEQSFRPPLAAHPIVQSIEAMDFATSCSIAPGGAWGRAPIRSLGLKSKGADYHADNYYPQPSDDAAMRYGAFVQLWAMRYGRGRVVAFSDSTIFSNFCVFDPGKSELMLGMIEWLNHGDDWRFATPPLLAAGLLMVGFSGGLSLRRRIPWPFLFAAALLGWSVAVGVVRLSHARQMPLPAPQREYVRVVLDRTVCQGPLSKNGFVDASGEGFGVFAQWILRLGYFTSRRDGEPFEGADLVLLTAPDRPADSAFLARLDGYLRSGGVVAVLDFTRQDSTADMILESYGLAFDRESRIHGVLKGLHDWPVVPVHETLGVTGGEPLAWVGQRVVGARQRVGAGTLVAIGFGSRFQDARMGYNLDVEPDEQLQRVFELEYALLPWLVEQNRQDE